jgi:hypothetical protein
MDPDRAETLGTYAVFLEETAKVGAGPPPSQSEGSALEKEREQVSGEGRRDGSALEKEREQVSGEGRRDGGRD